MQIGGQEADYVFLVMNPKGIGYLMRSKFSLGADAGGGGGAGGEPASAGTDLRTAAEILELLAHAGPLRGPLARGLGRGAGQGRGTRNVYDGEAVDSGR